MHYCVSLKPLFKSPASQCMWLTVLPLPQCQFPFPDGLYAPIQIPEPAPTKWNIFLMCKRHIGTMTQSKAVLSTQQNNRKHYSLIKAAIHNPKLVKDCHSLCILNRRTDKQTGTPSHRDKSSHLKAQSVKST